MICQRFSFVLADSKERKKAPETCNFRMRDESMSNGRFARVSAKKQNVPP
jgi:hypothetical protein